jgi:epoxyqueuosine reductase
LYCPWNRFECITQEQDFFPRHGLSDIELLDCFRWDKAQFLQHFEGSPIRRIGYQRWRRNIAIALGNAAYHPHILGTLQAALDEAGDMLAEHLDWAIQQQLTKQS